MNYQALFSIIMAFICLTQTQVVKAEQKNDSEELCSDVRLDQNNGPFSVIPVYNQRLNSEADPSICYAITASELIDAHLFKERGSLSRLTSPLSIALKSRMDDSNGSHDDRSGYDDTNPISFLVGGGSALRAINSNKNEWVCDQRWLENSIALISNQKAQSVEKFLKYTFSPKTSFNSDTILEALRKLHLDCKDNLFQLNIPEALEMKAPGGDYNVELNKLYEKTKDPNLTPEERKKMGLDFLAIYGPENRIAIFLKNVHQLLGAKEPKPVAIGFLYGALKPSHNLASIGGHAAVIIGRQWNTQAKKCEFLVRDSYGSSCTDAQGKNRYQLPCENGSVWVDALSLMRDTVNLTWIP